MKLLIWICHGHPNGDINEVKLSSSTSEGWRKNYCIVFLCVCVHICLNVSFRWQSLLWGWRRICVLLFCFSRRDLNDPPSHLNPAGRRSLSLGNVWLSFTKDSGIELRCLHRPRALAQGKYLLSSFILKAFRFTINRVLFVYCLIWVLSILEPEIILLPSALRWSRERAQGGLQTQTSVSFSHH